MYSNHFPDGLTPGIIDSLIAEAFDNIDETGEPASALLDGPAARRWARRSDRRVITGTVRTLPAVHSPYIGPPDGEEAA